MSIFDDIITLNHQVKLYVPSTTDVDVVNSEKQNEMMKLVLEKFSEWFGGATSQEAYGAWKSEEKGIVMEYVVICQSFCTDEQAREHLPKVLELAKRIKIEMAQEMVSMEFDNKLFLV